MIFALIQSDGPILRSSLATFADDTEIQYGDYHLYAGWQDNRHRAE
jgi:hypothetical protein